MGVVSNPVSEQDFRLLSKMEEEFDKENSRFFSELLSAKPSLPIRIHAVCILAEIGDESSIEILCRVLRADESALVRHEAAFSLGQLCYRNAVPALMEAVDKDPNILVRHESASALGSIGDERARGILERALNDPDEDVRNSAKVALFHLDYWKERGGKPMEVTSRSR